MDVIAVGVPVLVLASGLCLGRARTTARVSARAALVTEGLRTGSGRGVAPRWRRAVTAGRRRALTLLAAALAGAFLGHLVVGPVGAGVGGIAVAGVAALHGRGRGRRSVEVIERQLESAVEATALAVRSGFSVGQALEFAAEEVDEPMTSLLRSIDSEKRVGVPLEEALQHFADVVSTDDGRLFALVLAIHLRSGGNLSGALSEVALTIRHRVSIRRELRALTAQGRISGVILGALPLAFFLFLAVTSHRELAPVYRSPAGVAMLTVGLSLEVLSYLWIRRLLRVTL